MTCRGRHHEEVRHHGVSCALRRPPQDAMSSDTPSSPPLRTKVLFGAVWMIATRWSHRLLGLISTMILARLLMPEDFGLVATVVAAVAIMDGFFDFGFDLALIRDQSAGRAEFDAVWTLRFLKALLFGGLLMASSPWIADYAQAPEVVNISLIMGLGIAFKGLENIGVVVFQKELQFDRLFRFRLFPRLIGVAATIGLALWLRSYWAIVLGSLSRYICEVLFSYWMSDYRPRFRITGMGKLWHFSRWILVNNVSRQLFNAIDRFTLAGLVSKRDLGYYTVSADVASTVTVDLMGPAGSALVPGYAKLQDEPARLRSAFLISTAVFIALITPASIGVWCLAPELTAVLLGDQWHAAAPIIGLFALVWLFYAIAENLGKFMTMSGMQDKAALIGLGRTALFLGLFYPLFQWGGITAPIVLKLSLSVLEMIVLFSWCSHRLALPLPALPGMLWRPAAAAGAMALALTYLPLPSEFPTLATLVVKSGLGALVYTLVSLVLWLLSGRPAGLEAALTSLIVHRRAEPGAVS
ncbi:MAG: oligosaccharide flippase family protein [Denitromonas halophila]|nr:MAG: oligosaccharide flippase family protein [Denitromonas halophila]TVT73419.1 MAG: oligosaccharide flippase family protein [Denitromonas halophila]